MTKHPNRTSIGKHDIIRALTSNIMSTKKLKIKLDDLDVLFMEFVEFLGKQEGFEKHLDGKYKQEERKPSRGNSADGKK